MMTSSLNKPCRFKAGGLVTLQARFTRSNFWNVSRNNGDFCPARMLGSTNPKMSEATAPFLNCTDNFNVNVWQFGGSFSSNDGGGGGGSVGGGGDDSHHVTLLSDFEG